MPSAFWRSAKRLSATVFGGLGFWDHVAGINSFDGSPALPVLRPDYPNPGDVVLVDKFSVRHLGLVRRGDVITHISPDDPNTLCFDSVLALPGDLVYVGRGGDAGRAATAVLPGRVGDATTVVVPRGHCWLADDLEEGRGPVPLGLVKGHASRVLWPPSRFGKKIPPREPDSRRLLVRASSPGPYEGAVWGPAAAPL
jgi:inner membrane protease subunit 2